uniref:Uncharacterized protein n=1 Tax=Lactuca sativa TaxID=4236 RepID=A0A9R1VS95_LACSA|nr:hypothetical protein LSAT_V11C400203280 [Lactuca sativa]
MQDSFWRNVLYALKLTVPLVKFLRLVDGEKYLAMGYIYAAMDRAKQAICDSFSNAEDYKIAFQIIDQRIFYKVIVGVACEDVEQGLYGCIMRVVPDQEAQDKISTEVDKYKNTEGLFSHPMAIRHRKTKGLRKKLIADWWTSYGSSAPNVKMFAIWVLSLTCSATSYHINWSVLQHSRLNDMLFVKFNYGFDRRIKDMDKDPIHLQKIDESTEWLMGRLKEENDDDIVFVGEDLAWRDVAHASGAYEPSYLTKALI